MHLNDVPTPTRPRSDESFLDKLKPWAFVFAIGYFFYKKGR